MNILSIAQVVITSILATLAIWLGRRFFAPGSVHKRVRRTLTDLDEALVMSDDAIAAVDRDILSVVNRIGGTHSVADLWELAIVSSPSAKEAAGARSALAVHRRGHRAATADERRLMFLLHWRLTTQYRRARIDERIDTLRTNHVWRAGSSVAERGLIPAVQSGVVVVGLALLVPPVVVDLATSSGVSDEAIRTAGVVTTFIMSYAAACVAFVCGYGLSMSRIGWHPSTGVRRERVRVGLHTIAVIVIAILAGVATAMLSWTGWATATG